MKLSDLQGKSKNFAVEQYFYDHNQFPLFSEEDQI